ncbi:MAG: SPOR domain-containing protein [Pseudolabrys sp.]
MADDHSQRPYRSSETIARSGQARSPSPASGNDPLAELARLIGQTDPFGDLGKEPRRAAPQPEPVMDWTPASSQSYAPQQPAPPVAPDFPPQPAQHYAQPPASDMYEVEQDVPAYLTQQRAPAYDQRAYQGEAHEDAYDDLPPQRRRLGVVAIAGIFALAVVGTAGAFGYRAVFGGSGTRVPPPVIKADTAPSKIIPDTAAKDSNKLITERVGGGSDEKIVSREEKPVDIKDKIATPVFPPVTATAGQGGQALASAGNGVVAGEPRKVHTITIRPDQTNVADATASSPVAMPEPQPARTAAPPLAPARPQQQAANAEPQRAAQPAPRPAPPPAPAARSANAPLSLNPDAGPAPRAAAPAPTRTANAAPTSLAAAPSANPASASHGGYAVQVTSQRSEGEAQTAYQALQGKYGSVLGGRSMFVHKVELGAKGTYYRAMVGPFGSQAEASQLCSSLKSAGGSCLVQRN